MWTSGVVSKLCVSKLCVGGGRAGRCGQAEVHNQKQEPHAKMCGKIEYYGKTMVAECEQEKNKHGT